MGGGGVGCHEMEVETEYRFQSVWWPLSSLGAVRLEDGISSGRMGHGDEGLANREAEHESEEDCELCLTNRQAERESRVESQDGDNTAETGQLVHPGTRHERLSWPRNARGPQTG